MNMNRQQNNRTIAITHDHTMYGLAARRKQGERAVFSQYYAPEFVRGGVNVIGWVAGGDPPFFSIDNDHAWSGTLELLDMLWQEAEECRDSLVICLNFQDMERAVEEGKIALFITIEGGLALEQGERSNSVMNLRTLHQSGVRSLQLVGQGWNQLMVSQGAHPAPSSGLSAVGKEIVREMNRLGMVINLSQFGAGFS